MTSSRGRPDWATIPNLVTLARFALLAPVCVLLWDGAGTLAVVLLLVWASTDWIDGLLARALGQTSRTGAIIDPIADRLGLAAIAATLVLVDLLPWAALVIILVVDLATTVLATGAALGGRIEVSILGKVRTAVLVTSVFLLVAAAAWAPGLVGAVQVLVWTAVGLHVLSGGDYILRASRAPRVASAGEGPPSPR
ncbi:phosphatidylglycerophosphate synthase [Brachybacterium sp. P6-10-X1]|uniref:CDP-alcohol phosphatidyltransferase family protein n=1 Tax=Brachybacterium sp. P6-10-X1 TaxID=1903186 RepID=UPI0009717C89|nr:CDP-alcohol phosphatidyltransferase family protein [Brachybacterium sp. P6-10-X1]APX34499.1 phosphatidylglycerophosphate synthase [Brachybacterium sp. P6-10-X1]